MTGIVRDIVYLARPGASIRSISRLHGGQSAITHLVRMQNSPDLVVRRFEKAYHREERTAAVCEAHCLARLATAPIHTPSLIWADPTGEHFGMGVVVATRMRGRGRARTDQLAWVDGIARELAELHRLQPTDEDRAVLPIDPASQRTWLTASAPAALGTVGRTIWPAIIEQFADYKPARERIVHGDYHPGNVLNIRGHVTAVIDWESAMLGPPAFDVGYCQMDLALAHGPAVGDSFLEAYDHHAGGPPEHLALFQLVSVVRAIPQLGDWIPSWQAQGINALTLEILEQRLARFAASTLQRAAC